MNTNALYGLLATLFTWSVTALGAALVFLFKRRNETLINIMLGFSAGIMIAASFWSLLEPAFSGVNKPKKIILITISFVIGSLFMILTDFFAKKIDLFKQKQGSHSRYFLLILSITLHNIPEGLAVGVAFGSLGAAGGETLAGAIGIALGIGIQNFPEGAAISLPLRSAGMSRTRAFLYGQGSALVEPVFGFLGALLVTGVKWLLPYSLSFAAGAMVMVAVHELIPECEKISDKSYKSTLSVICGFALMMFLDVLLG